MSFSGDAGEDPQKVGQAVEKKSNNLRDGFAGFVQGQDASFRTAGDSSGIVKAGASQ